MASSVPSEQDVLGFMDTLSNWGRWGDGDEMGTLNTITPEKRVAAAGLVTEGITVSCARPVTTEVSADMTYQVVRHMVDSGEGRDTDPPERRAVRRGTSEFVGMVFHGRTVTHVDSLSHFSWSGKMYNGVPSSRATSREGARSLSVEAAREGIVTRGVLLDACAATGKPWYEPGTGVMPEELDAADWPPASPSRLEMSCWCVPATTVAGRSWARGTPRSMECPLATSRAHRGSTSGRSPCWAPTLPTR